MTYSIDRATGIVRLANDETPTYEEWERVMLAIFADPDYRPGFSFFGDGRGLPPSKTEMVRRTVEFAKRHPRELGRSHWAIVVDTPAMYGMSRMGKSLGESYIAETRIFSTVEDAEAWLHSIGSAEGSE
jgi:hypothetical protein